MSHIDEFCAVIEPAELDILDVGAGKGDFVHALCQRGARAVGVEIDPVKVARAQTANDVPVLLGSGEDMPVGDASRDVVAFMYSLHHVPPQLQSKALSEAARVLRPGGRLYICEPEIDGDMSRIVAAVDDETEVRKHALQALCQPEFARLFEEISRRSYVLKRKYESFEELVRAVVLVDEKRAGIFESSHRQMRGLFERFARPTEQGYEISQPSSAYLFARR